MNRAGFILTLLDDVVISSSAATLGGHRSLDYVPGQALLGACAARTYQAFGADAFRVFHGGAVRFGNATPMTPGGRPGLPVPMCWHQRKRSPAATGLSGARHLDAARLQNFAVRNGFSDNEQPQQLRSGYVGEDGSLVEPLLALTMKTAINPDTGRAADAQLFGYQALPCQTRLGGWIEADDAGLLESVLAGLEGELLLGRSRSAQYGRARFERADFEPPESRLDENASVTFWLLSDLALIDDWGQPTLDPRPQHMGLPAGEVDWARTFIRQRRYSPWNGKRRAPDLERQVIMQGSIITIRFETRLDSEQLQRIGQGLGLYREGGLGRVLVNHPLLYGQEPQFTVAQQPKGGDTGSVRPDDPLIAWLESQATQGSTMADIKHRADDLAGQFRQYLRRARAEKGITEDLQFGPSRSQWGDVFTLAKAESGERLFEKLFQFHDDPRQDRGLVKRTAEGWQETCFDQKTDRLLTLAEAFHSLIKDIEHGKSFSRLVQALAHAMRERSADSSAGGTLR